MLDRQTAVDLVAEHLGLSPRAVHSLLVGRLMRGIATHLGADETLFELVGLCHDIDFETTRAEPERHGVAAAEWLAGSLPAGACEAIAAHDHRSGRRCDTTIAIALRLADACAIASEPMGDRMGAALMAGPPWPELRALNRGRPYLAGLIEGGMQELGLRPAELGQLFNASPD